MTGLPDFHGAFVKFVQDEAYKEGSDILLEKDIPRKEFNMNSLRSFTYKDQLGMGPLNLLLFSYCIYCIRIQNSDMSNNKKTWDYK